MQALLRMRRLAPESPPLCKETLMARSAVRRVSNHEGRRFESAWAWKKPFGVWRQASASGF
jgi:hypothetical protein